LICVREGGIKFRELECLIDKIIINVSNGGLAGALPTASS
jgi:hypothetical protein